MSTMGDLDPIETGEWVDALSAVQQHRGKGMRVAGQDRDPRALGDATLRQAGGGALADMCELGIGPARLAAGNSQLVGVTHGTAMKQVVQGLAANDGTHGVSLYLQFWGK